MSTNLLQATLSDIPGLCLRHYTSPWDAVALLAIHNACAERDQTDYQTSCDDTPQTVEELSSKFTPGIQADRGVNPDVVLAEVDGAPVGYARVLFWTEVDGTWLYLILGWTRPTWRGRGIGTNLLHWGEARARELAAGHPTGGRAYYGANANQTETDTAALLAAEGYQERFHLIEREHADLSTITPAVLPAGLSLRPLASQDFLAIGRSIREAYGRLNLASDDPEYQRWLVNGDEQQARWLSGFDPAFCRVAWNGDQVAGQVLCSIQKGRGEVDEVSVRAPYRGRGLARSLVTDVLHALHASGTTTARIHTRSDNAFGSNALYESIGFRSCKSYGRYWKPMQL